MRRDFTSRTCGISGVSDLTIMAPIRPGLVESIESVTYKSRVKRVLRALHVGRQAAHEYDLARVLSDAVERVGRIHSVRIAVLEPEGQPEQVLLAVTFDGPWEAYVRVIWQKVARLLDLVFCNTVDHVDGEARDYIDGWSHSYEQWADWIRRHQVETPFLYAQPGVTADDVMYLKLYERMDRRERVNDLALTQASLPSAEEIADRLMIKGADPTNLGASPELVEEAQAKPAAFKQGMRSLAGIYRLAELYPPGTPEGRWLLRAAHELLPEFRRLLRPPDIYTAGLRRVHERFKEQLAWFQEGFEPQPAHRSLRPPPKEPPLQGKETIQAGILAPHGDVSHGVLLLLSFASREAIRQFLGSFVPTTEGAPAGPGQIASNIGISIEGLRLAGLDDEQVKALPEEFVAGMEKRAGWLGDLRVNHPRRWRLPAHNWSAGVDAIDPSEDDPAPRIDMAAVHVVVQLRLRVGADGTYLSQDDGRKKLLVELERLVAACPGAAPLSLQWMHRLHGGADGKETVEHFGFGDGHSDPVLHEKDAGKVFANHVHAGDALIGYENAADPPPPAPVQDSVADMLFNGSYLVVRKLRQDLAALEETVQRSVHPTAEGCPALDRRTLLAKMMGRWPADHPTLANRPLADDSGTLNDFVYSGDPGGTGCPLQAHIRRANPRTVAPDGIRPLLEEGARPPRIFRRSLSYGPQRDAAGSNLHEERGLVFMAYNASIGEQFEVVQRWLTGGNSTGAGSATPDPFLGIAEAGRRRIFRFPHGANVERVHLDGDDELHAEPRPLVRLEWGCYFLAPSTAGLKALAQWKSGAERKAAGAAVPWNEEEGKKLIERLQAIRDPEEAKLAWKAALEDQEAASDYSAPSIWAAIRKLHGGVLRTAYGTLVASDELVQRELQDPHGQRSVKGYLKPMGESFGEIFLGFDDNGDGSGKENDKQNGKLYRAESQACDEAIMKLDQDETYAMARACTEEKLKELIGEAKKHAREEEEGRRIADVPPRLEVPWELAIDLRELVDPLLGRFCEHWFGLEDGEHFRYGGFSWSTMPARYPGHFMAPSRYFFQPHPGAEAARLGKAHGQAAVAAMESFLHAKGANLQQPVVRAVLDSDVAGKDPTFAARTLVGAIMGFVPTVNGSLRRVLLEWLRDGTFWTLRAQRDALPINDWEKLVDRALERALQLRAMPDTVWRTATDAQPPAGDTTGAVDVPAGEIVVIGTLSAAHERLERGTQGLETIFGGPRDPANPPGGRPTHACPGMYLAINMMKGFLDALLASPERMRAGIAPLSLMFDGRESVPLEPGPLPQPGPALVRGLHLEAFHGDIAFTSRRAGPPLVFARTSTATIWCIGDSWLTDLPGFFLPDIVGELANLGYVRAPATRDYAKTGRTLQEIASKESLRVLERAFTTYRPPHREAPRAILLGGGGNDIVQPEYSPKDTRLYQVLAEAPADAKAGITQLALDAFIADMKGHYETILDKFTTWTDVPILLHGYDWPFPDGERATPVHGPWLHHVFNERRVAANLKLRREIMVLLIDALNRMGEGVAQDYRSKGHKVHHMGFAGLLESQQDFDENNHRVYWHDELHPNDKGCRVIAAKIAGILADLGVRP